MNFELSHAAIPLPAKRVNKMLGMQELIDQLS